MDDANGWNFPRTMLKVCRLIRSIRTATWCALGFQDDLPDMVACSSAQYESGGGPGKREYFIHSDVLSQHKNPRRSGWISSAKSVLSRLNARAQR
jgi:hypothetical protein